MFTPRISSRPDDGAVAVAIADKDRTLQLAQVGDVGVAAGEQAVELVGAHLIATIFDGSPGWARCDRRRSR
jgi:hypothetical protein